MVIRECPYPGGLQCRLTGERYCPRGAYGYDWTPEKCDECEAGRTWFNELLGDCLRDEGRDGFGD